MSDAAISIMRGSARLTSREIGGFCVTDIVFPPLVTLPSHYHARACFAVVLEGSVDKAFHHSAAYPSPPNTIVTMPPEERHGDQFERQGARLLVVEPVDVSREVLQPCADVLTRVNHFREDEVTDRAWRIAHELAWPDVVSPLVIEGLVLEMLALAMRRNASQPIQHQPPLWLSNAEEFLRASFNRSVRMTEVAAAVGVHPVHLARTFRQHYGLTPGAYVRRLRLDWAAAQLATSTHPLASIAVEAGFSDQSHFTRTFRGYTGLTPAQYRKARAA